MHITQETKKLITYVIIGVSLTFLTYVIWEYLSLALGFVIQGYENEILSTSYFVAAFMVIGLSLYLNRKITFKSHERRHSSKMQTILHFYGVYCIGALAGAVFTFVVSRYGFGTSANLIKFGALSSTVVINYFGQRFWIYK